MVGLDSALLGILLIGAVSWAWQAGLKVRERATSIAKQTCRRDGLQFLEGTVALQRLRPCRDGQGRFAWRRTYLFDYSDDGLSRRQGFVIFSGQRLDCVGLAAAPEPHRGTCGSGPIS